MHAARSGRLLSAVALSALVGACADQSNPVAPSSLSMSPSFVTASAAPREVQVCKVGINSASGTFTFAYTVDSLNGSPVVNATVNIDVGQCATIVTVPDIGGKRALVSVTEMTLPADWSLTSIMYAYTTTPGGFPVPSIAGNTISNIGVANDVGAVVTFTNTYTPPPPPSQGCTYTLGYWKTHSEFGPAPYDPTWAKLPNGASTTFFLSGNTWIGVFGTPPAGNAYYQWSQQDLAAKLNVLGGADPTAAAAAIASAETLFNSYTPAQVAALPKNSATRALFISLAGTLDKYNNGIIGPGHC